MNEAGDGGGGGGGDAVELVGCASSCPARSNSVLSQVSPEVGAIRSSIFSK